MTPDEFAVEIHDLVRVYRAPRALRTDARPVVALDHLTLSVCRGEFFGLLGPNGAGKTTLIKVLTTLLLPTSGTARVAGWDVARDPQRVRERISVVSGGETSGYGLLTVREQLWMFSQFYGIPTPAALARIDRLLRVVGLYEERNRRISQLSTGMRQKMNVVRALLPDPEVLFLDEPTVGLDVEAARDIRAHIRSWVQEKPGRTVVLTTHLMHEAEELCDRVAIIHRGRIVACDTPSALRHKAAGGTFFVLTTDPWDGHRSLEVSPGVLRSDVRPLTDGRVEVRLQLDEDATLLRVLQELALRGIRIHALRKVEPSLEDAFVRIVGRRMEEADAEVTP